MKTYIAIWPNKTFSVVTASDWIDLMWTLDEEGDPGAVLELIEKRRGESVTSDWRDEKLVFTSGKSVKDEFLRAILNSSEY
jgi:hypothetical protein